MLGLNARASVAACFAARKENRAPGFLCVTLKHCPPCCIRPGGRVAILSAKRLPVCGGSRRAAIGTGLVAETHLVVACGPGRCEGKAHCVTADGTSSRHRSHAIGDHLQFDIYGSKRLRALSDPELRARPGSITKVGERRKRRSARR